MRISFDLDNTLICYQDGALYEPRPVWFRRIMTNREPLRKGTCALIQKLKAAGWEVWVYTTSFRKPGEVRRWLRSYGIRIDKVINQATHDRCLKRDPGATPPSKHPRAFGIHLHVDDSEGVKIEGERHGFKVVVVNPDDEQWANAILNAAINIESAYNNQC